MVSKSITVDASNTVLVDDSIIETISAKLLPEPPKTDSADLLVPDWDPVVPFDRPPVLAAVLIALVQRPEGLTVLYTERSPALRSHSGQVAFPGGKVDPTDAGPGAAAIREAGEEVGMVPQDARILGYLAPYFTGTNYLIMPVVATVRPSAPFVPNPGEVHSIFEVPLERIRRAENFTTFRVSRNGIEHSTWQLDHDGHRIWGITANLTRRFHELLQP